MKPYESRLNDMLGKEMTWEQSAPRQRQVHGVVTAWEWAGCLIRSAEGVTEPGVKFRIKPIGGGRAIWTGALPAWPIHGEEP